MPSKKQLPRRSAVGLYTVAFERPATTELLQSVTDDDDATDLSLLEVIRAEYLARSDDRRVLHLAIKSSSASVRKYKPGDAIGIRCTNELDDVQCMLRVLQRAHGSQLRPDEPFYLL
jgi:sulfite reductase alpha subunit-like flavoprotein